jgi:hypothetical protein
VQLGFQNGTAAPAKREPDDRHDARQHVLRRIQPQQPAGPNAYDFRLGTRCRTYVKRVLDVRRANATMLRFSSVSESECRRSPRRRAPNQTTSAAELAAGVSGLHLSISIDTSGSHRLP